MSFVTDLIWRSPLGLRINAQATADVADDRGLGQDRAAISSRRATAPTICASPPSCGRRTSSTYVSLLVVDHPGRHRGVRRRAVRGAAAEAAGGRRPARSSRSRRSVTTPARDVTALAARLIHGTSTSPAAAPYQGITREHFVEIELPDAAPRTGPLWLVAQRLDPSDRQLDQRRDRPGRARRARGPVARRRGRRRPLPRRCARVSAFPPGKDKTILIDLTGAVSGEPGRAGCGSRPTSRSTGTGSAGRSAGPTSSLQPRRLDLLTRGPRLSRLLRRPTSRPRACPSCRATRSTGTAPALARPRGLLHAVRRRARAAARRRRSLRDHERRRRAAAALPRSAAARAPGCVRDFVVVGDGWVKDGDYNTELLADRAAAADAPDRPLRSRRRARLEDDPVYRQHPDDFAEYHTRYVTPEPAARRAAPPAAQRAVRHAATMKRSARVVLVRHLRRAAAHPAADPPVRPAGARSRRRPANTARRRTASG